MVRWPTALAMQMPMSSCPGVKPRGCPLRPGSLVWLFVLVETAALAVTVAGRYRAEVVVVTVALPPGSCRPGRCARRSLRSRWPGHPGA